MSRASSGAASTLLGRGDERTAPTSRARWCFRGRPRSSRATCRSRSSSMLSTSSCTACRLRPWSRSDRRCWPSSPSAPVVVLVCRQCRGRPPARALPQPPGSAGSAGALGRAPTRRARSGRPSLGGLGFGGAGDRVARSAAECGGSHRPRPPFPPDCASTGKCAGPGTPLRPPGAARAGSADRSRGAVAAGRGGPR